MDLASLYRQVATLRSTLEQLKRGIMRLGEVKTVDLTECTIVVEYDDEDEDGAPVQSMPMPWFQRSTEHQPPVIGDHVLVIDPSLGMGASFAIVGWPSTAKPAPEAGGPKHVLLKQYGSLIVVDDQGLCKLNNVEVDVDGNTMIPETLLVEKATTLNDTLAVAAETTIGGATTINADLTVNSGGPQIAASAGGVNLAGGADFVALSLKVDANFTALKTILITAFTSVGAALAANGALGAAQMAAFTPVPTAALKVKAT